jgi:hypothetical protein
MTSLSTKWKTFSALAASSLLALSLASAGCGGGGDGGSLSGDSGRVGVFVTDGFREDFSHVWVTIYQVDIVDVNGQVQTGFSDPAGRVIDVKTLRDASGERFTFLGDAAVTPGTHSKVRVTIAPTVGLVNTGSSVTNMVQVSDDFARDSQGRAILEFNLITPRNLASGSDDIVIDFDLSQFILTGGKLRLVAKEGSHNGLTNRLRQERDHHTGVISNLTTTATGFRFTLTRGNGQTFTVETNAGTTIYNANNSPSPTLANGKLVRVQGTFDPVANVFTATSVRIQGSGQSDNHNPEVSGTVVSVNTLGQTFVMNATKVEDFVPSQATVNVIVAPSTVFRSHGGLLLTSTEFFSLLAAGMPVEVEGTYDGGTNTLTATRIKLEGNENDDDHEAEVRGTVTNANSAVGTFTVNPVTEFEGFVLNGTSVNVVTNGSTTFRSLDNNTINSATFFAGLTPSTTVKVEGTYSAGTITATKVQVR